MKRNQPEKARALPSRKPAEDDARTLLEMTGIQPTDEQYKFFFRLIVAILYTTTNHTAVVNDYGKDLAELLSGQITEDKLETVRWIAADLQQLKLNADWRTAWQLVRVTADTQRSRRKSNKNLKREPPKLTRDQAIAAVKRYGSQEKAAEAHEISERRLRKIINGK